MSVFRAEDIIGELHVMKFSDQSAHEVNTFVSVQITGRCRQ